MLQRPAKDMTVTHYLIQSKSTHECVYCKVTNKKRSQTSRLVNYLFSSNRNCFVKYHQSLTHQRFLIEKKYKYKGIVNKIHQKRTPTKGSGRPQGTVKSKGWGS